MSAAATDLTRPTGHTAGRDAIRAAGRDAVRAAGSPGGGANRFARGFRIAARSWPRTAGSAGDQAARQVAFRTAI